MNPTVEYNNHLLRVSFDRALEHTTFKSFKGLRDLAIEQSFFNAADVTALHLQNSDNITANDIKKAFPKLETLIIDDSSEPGSNAKFDGDNLIFKGGIKNLIIRDSGLTTLFYGDDKVPHKDLKTLTVIGCRYIDLNKISTFLRHAALESSPTEIRFALRCRKKGEPFVEAGMLGLRFSNNILDVDLLDLDGETIDTQRINLPEIDLDNKIAQVAERNLLSICTFSEYSKLLPASLQPVMDISYATDPAFIENRSKENAKSGVSTSAVTSQTIPKKGLIKRIVTPVIAVIAGLAVILSSKQKSAPLSHSKPLAASDLSVHESAVRANDELQKVAVIIKDQSPPAASNIDAVKTVQLADPVPAVPLPESPTVVAETPATQAMEKLPSSSPVTFLEKNAEIAVIPDAASVETEMQTLPNTFANRQKPIVEVDRRWKQIEKENFLQRNNKPNTNLSHQSTR